MLLIPSPIALQAEPPGSLPEAAFEQAGSSADPAETWLLVITGLCSATFMANLICTSPQPHATSPSIYWIIIFLKSGIFLALTAAAGAAGIFAPWFFLKTKPSFAFDSLAKKVGLGWAFLPCITLLYRRHSPWMFLVLAITTIAIAFNIRRLVPAAAAPLPSNVPPWHTGVLPSLQGLPGPDSRPSRSFFLALCLQGALVSAIAEYLFPAAILLSIFMFLLVWRWSAFDSTATKTFANKRSSTLLYTLAFCLTILMLIPPVSRAGGAFAAGRAPRTPPTFAHGPSATSDNDYIGIVLWPPPVKKQVLPPIPRPSSFATGGAAKPLVIPFDGQYWYFKAPYVRPGPHAHVARGKPTDVTVRSSDLAPLLMEAHQVLDKSIDLACCREIEIAITNADIRPGRISLGLILTDSTSPDKPSRNLGSRPIASSEPANIPLNREPIKEVLRFPIPRSSTTHRFNEITIVYIPTPERARGGAKVSIQSLTLTPR
jgi:hypothetical protein